VGLLREQGVYDLQNVKIAYIESDGGLSVKTDGRQGPHSKQAPQDKRQSGI
jgi:uncharacterized membrane protein YcaP (DUF421 family)